MKKLTRGKRRYQP